jgi:hypothetical protein
VDAPITLTRTKDKLIELPLRAEMQVAKKVCSRNNNPLYTKGQNADNMSSAYLTLEMHKKCSDCFPVWTRDIVPKWMLAFHNFVPDQFTKDNHNSEVSTNNTTLPLPSIVTKSVRLQFHANRLCFITTRL